jgi:HPt (histidine-containing phosphotransfer) domain-containing protein
MSKDSALRPLSERPLLTVETIGRIYGESGAELISDTLQQFRTEALGYVTKVAELWHTGAFDEITRYVHSLKTMSAMVGAERMAKLCQVFERQLKGRDMVEAQRSYPVFQLVWSETLQQVEQHILPDSEASVDVESY